MTPIKYAIAINKNGCEEYMHETNGDDCFTDDIGLALIYEKWTDIPKLQSTDEYIVEVETDTEGGLSAGTKWTRPMTTAEQERAEARIDKAKLLEWIDQRRVKAPTKEAHDEVVRIERSIKRGSFDINSLDREEQLIAENERWKSANQELAKQNRIFHQDTNTMCDKLQAAEERVAEQDKEIQRLKRKIVILETDAALAKLEEENPVRFKMDANGNLTRVED